LFKTIQPKHGIAQNGSFRLNSEHVLSLCMLYCVTVLARTVSLHKKVLGI